jgi:hypothetical protein
MNQPGVRRKGKNAVVIQFAKRSAQLNGIAEFVTGALCDPSANAATDGIRLTPEQVHRIKGYMEQIGIVADELANAGN